MWPFIIPIALIVLATVLIVVLPVRHVGGVQHRPKPEPWRWPDNGRRPLDVEQINRFRAEVDD